MGIITDSGASVAFFILVLLASTFYHVKKVKQQASELVQLKLNIETSVEESTPTEPEYEVPLPLIEVGVSRLDDSKNIYSKR